MQRSVTRGPCGGAVGKKESGDQPDLGWGKGRVKPIHPVGCSQVIGWRVVGRQRERIVAKI